MQATQKFPDSVGHCVARQPTGPALKPVSNPTAAASASTRPRIHGTVRALACNKECHCLMCRRHLTSGSST